MRNLPKKVIEDIKKNKETTENISSCKNIKNCRDRLSAKTALNDINAYRRDVKFDGGGV